MAQLELTFAVIAIIAGCFLAWLYTKSGKKWLANL
jgi:drug/metabolite transporter superfamily protein YnfA